MKASSLAIVALFAVALTAPAEAQNSVPPPRPQQDVTITYQYVASEGARPSRRTVYVQANTGVTRSSQGAAANIFDFAARKRYIFPNPGHPAGRDVTARVEPIENRDDLSRWHLMDIWQVSRGEQRTIAGQACTMWHFNAGGVARAIAPAGRRSNVCATPDGLILLEENFFGSEGNRLTATQVTYGRVDPALFTPPADLR